MANIFTPPGTALTRPWALITRGGPRPDAARPTRLAYLIEAITAHGQPVAYRGFVMRADRTGATRYAQRIELLDVVEIWPAGTTPSGYSVDRARTRFRQSEASRRHRRAA